MSTLENFKSKPKIEAKIKSKPFSRPVKDGSSDSSQKSQTETSQSSQSFQTETSSSLNALELSNPFKLETLDIEPFTQMLHISDIHIRPLDRHDEFKSVFLNTREKLLTLSRQEKSVIIVTGDIFDNKSIFKPETFMLARDFIRMLTQIAPVIMIAGNHDMLEQNTTRLDALTPVTDGFNIHYLKWSGVYIIKNTSEAFVVSSLYDKQFIKHVDLKHLTHLNLNFIALYHGDLAGATTDINYTIENEDEDGTGSARHKTKDDFNGFKAVLMGDIHKHQIFTNDIGAYIAYSGSLIQQNHGETIENHGILVWNKIANNWNKPILHEVHNEYGFIDVACENGLWINRGANVNLPKHCYARLLINKCTETQVEIICADLKREISLLNGSLLITKKQALNVSRTEEMTLQDANPDLKRKEDEIEFIKDQAIENGMDGNALVKLHVDYQQSIDHNSLMSAAVWKPIMIEFKNLFGYSGSTVNKIRFKEGCTSLNAPNAHGKSSTVNAILFGIFGRVPLNPSKSAVTYDVVNNNETGGYVKVLLTYGNVYYLIERRSVKSKGKASTSLELQNLTKYEFTCEIWLSNCNSEKVKNCCDDKVNNNDRFIEQMFGDIDTFSLTNLLNKESSLDLISMTPSEQVKILKGIFKMDVYDIYKDMNKKKLSEQEEAISELKQDVKSLKRQVSTDVSTEKLSELQLSVKFKQGELEEDEELLNELQEELQLQLSTYNTHANDFTSRLPVETLEEVELELSSLTLNLDLALDLDLDLTLDELKVLQFEYSHINTKKQELTSALKDVNFSIIWSKEETEQLIDELNDELNKVKLKIPAEYLNLKEAKVHSLLGGIESQLESLNLTLTLTLKTTDEQATKEELQKDILQLQKKIKPLTSSIEVLVNLKSKTEDMLSKFNEIDCEDLISLNLTKDELINLTFNFKREIYNLEQDNLKLKLTSSRNEHYTGTEVPVLIKGISTDFNTELNMELVCACSTVLELKSKRDTLVTFLISDKGKIIEDLCDCYLIDDKIKSLYSLDDEYRLVQDSLVEKLIVNFENEDKQEELNTCIISIGKLEDRIKYLEDVKANYENFLNLNQLKYLRNLQDLKEAMLKLDKCEKMLKIYELKSIAYEISLHDFNLKLTEEISHLQNRLQYMTAKESIDQLNVKKLDLTLALDYFAIIADIAAANDNLKYLKQKEELAELTLRCEELNLNIIKRKTLDRFKYLKEIHATIVKYNEHLKISNEIKPLKEEIFKLKNEITVKTAALSKIKEQLTLMEFKVQKQEETLKEISSIESNLVAMELHVKPYRDYNVLLGNKGIVSKLLYCKIKSIEGYINSILENFTHYKILIDFDDKKQTMHIMSHNHENSKALSTSRFSGYEKLVLQVAFKRALNKFSYNSKSSLIIIDEAFDCIDPLNFDTKLKDLMQLITQDYSTCLAISQRDISHISDINMKISKINGVSKLEVLKMF